MKKLLTILFIIISIVSFGQPIINRTFGTNSVNDPRLMASLNLFIPRYADTTAASAAKGIDTCGAIIFCYSDGNVYIRRCSPLKYWAAIGSSSGFTTANNGLSATSATNVVLGYPEATHPLSMDFTGNREISSDSDLVISNKGSAFYVANPSQIRLHAINNPEVKLNGNSGGGITITMTNPPGGGAFPGIYYFNTVSDFVGQSAYHLVGAEHHFDIFDMRGTTLSAQIQADGVGQFVISRDGSACIGCQVDRVDLGGSATAGIFRGFVDVHRSLYVQDTLILAHTLPSVSATDSVLVKSGNNVKAIAQSSIVGATPTWQQTLTSGSTLSGNNTATLGTTSFTWSSANTTAATTSSPIVETYNNLTTGTGHYASSSSQTSGVLSNYIMTGTAGDGKTAISITSTGANAGINKIIYGISSNIANSGTGSSNVGFYSNVSSAESSYGFYADGGSGVSSLGVADQKIGFFANITGGTVNVGGRFVASGGSTNFAIQTSGAVAPIANDGSALGTGALSFSDLFLASGGVINFNNGTYTLTQNSTNLTASGTFQVTGVLFANNQINDLSVASLLYRTTNAGSDATPRIFMASASGQSGAGNLGLAWETTNQLAFTHGNGTRAIGSASIGITGLNNGAGTEAADMFFNTQTAGAAPTTKLTIGGNGVLSIGAPTLNTVDALIIQSLTNTNGQGLRIYYLNNSSYSEYGPAAILNPGGFSIQSSGATVINLSSSNVYIGGSTTPTSTLQTGGSFAAAYVAKTGTYSATATDYAIDCTANTFTVTLPTAVGITGRIYNITNSGAGTITIATTSSQTFTNVSGTPTTLTLSAVGNYQVMSTGSNWIVL